MFSSLCLFPCSSTLTTKYSEVNQNHHSVIVCLGATGFSHRDPVAVTEATGATGKSGMQVHPRIITNSQFKQTAAVHRVNDLSRGALLPCLLYTSDAADE